MKLFIRSGLSIVTLTSMLSPVILPMPAAICATKTVQSGNTTAELSYQTQKTNPKFSNLRLKIVRAGQILLDRPLPKSEGSWPVTALETDWAKENQTFQVRDLDADQEPEVLLDLYTGGAHCCTYSLIYRYNTTKNQYSHIRHDWGNRGYTLKNVDQDTTPEFSSQDDRFAYAFGSYAGSGYPLQIWQYRQGEMQQVTRRYPKLIYSDAYAWWQIFVKHRHDTVEYGKGPLAAYLADKYLLGQGQDGWNRIQQVYQGSDRRQYFTELRSFLQKTGYTQTDLNAKPPSPTQVITE